MLGTGIWLTDFTRDLTRFEVKMKLTWFNRNMVGIHYGGSLYSMCDPWYMFILAANLGNDYVVLDKAANIRYVKPGNSTVYGTFEINPARIDDIRQEINQVGKKDYTFTCQIKKNDGEVVCEVDKVVYVRKKDFNWSKSPG
jgi:acyl-coenzyme A thioesterase PaaI-like protein